MINRLSRLTPWLAALALLLANAALGLAHGPPKAPTSAAQAEAAAFWRAMGEPLIFCARPNAPAAEVFCDACRLADAAGRPQAPPSPPWPSPAPRGRAPQSAAQADPARPTDAQPRAPPLSPT